MVSLESLRTLPSGILLITPESMPDTRALISYSFSHDSPAIDDIGGQGDVAGDHQVARLRMLGDVRIRDIEAARNLHRADERRRRRAQHLIGHQRQGYLPSLRRTEQDVLDDGGTGVCVDPDMHGCLS